MSARTDKSRAKTVRVYRIGVSLFLLFVFTALFLHIGISSLGSETYENKPLAVATTTPLVPIPVGRIATHISTPTVVKAIYMTSCVASAPSLRENLLKFMDETEINSVVIDIKSFDGHISFMPKSEELKVALGGCFVKDMQDFIDKLHAHGIYVIGREASFQDQLMVKLHPDQAVKKLTATSTIWRDHKGIAWIDASSRRHWEYLLALAKESHAIGFDEINFDYIRFPADGNMKDISFPISGNKKKYEVMRSFYEFLHENLAPLGITTSADIFGMTTTNTDDLNIGQILEYALANFDYVSPMVYPSHYPYNFMNLGNPNEHVYQIVNFSMARAAARALATTTSIEMPGSRIGTSTPAIYAKPSWNLSKLRPWLQDNNYPVPYTPEMVRAQIKAANDAKVTSWALWNAGNRYTKSALSAQ